MRKILISSAAFLIASVVSLNAFACISESDYDLSKVDVAKGQIVLVKGEASKTFTTGEKTEVTINGKSAKLAQLKVGDKIAIDYENTSDVLAIKASREG